MDSVLWHKVSPDEREKIKKQAKEVMDSFAEALKKVEPELSDNFEVRRKRQFRGEGKGKISKNFRKFFFENAPSKSGDFIKAERGKWK